MDDVALKSEEIEDRGFDIIHFSYRKKTASGKNFAEKLNLEGETDEEILKIIKL